VEVKEGYFGSDFGRVVLAHMQKVIEVKGGIEPNSTCLKRKLRVLSSFVGRKVSLRNSLRDCLSPSSPLWRLRRKSRLETPLKMVSMEFLHHTL